MYRRAKSRRLAKAKLFLLFLSPTCLLLAAKVSKNDIGNTKESKTYSQQLKDVPKVTVEKSRASIANKRSGKCRNEKKERIVDDPTGTKQRRKTETTDPMNDRMEDTAKDTSTKSVNSSKSTVLKSPFRTSTPRRGEASEQDNLTGKEANTEYDTSASNSSVRHDASTNNCSARDACVTNALNDDDNTAAKKNESKEKKVRCRHKKTEKVKKEKKPESKKTSDSSTKTASRCRKHDKKTSTAGKPVIVLVFIFGSCNSFVTSFVSNRLFAQ